MALRRQAAIFKAMAAAETGTYFASDGFLENHIAGLVYLLGNRMAHAMASFRRAEAILPVGKATQAMMARCRRRIEAKGVNKR